MILVTNQKLLNFFSFLKNTDSAILVFHHDSVAVVQFKKKDDAFTLVGYNELALTEGIIENGNIINMGVFKEVLADLFSQAQPKAIMAKKLFVNIPYHLLYTYVKDFSNQTGEDSMRNSMLEAVKEYFPISVEELTLDFVFSKGNSNDSSAVYASPKIWRERIKKVCKSVGVDTIEFIPEPLCHVALKGENSQEDAALFSCYRNRVYLSLFRNGLIYDSYFLLSLENTEALQCFNCQQEFAKAQKDFSDQFETPLNNLYFIGFDKTYQQRICKHFKPSGEKLTMIGSDNAKLAELIPFDSQEITLFGLFNIAVSGYLE